MSMPDARRRALYKVLLPDRDAVVDPDLTATARALLSLANLLPEACTLLEADARPEAKAWVRKAQRAAFNVIARRESP